MDVKGITWVGNIYQKFEAMCLEVEEIMYQDTVDFVENHVQTVGASVKKFYSGVVQDLLPPSSIDAGKKEITGIDLKQYDAEFIKKPKVQKKKEPVKADVDNLRKRTKILGHVERKSLAVTSLPGPCHVENVFPMPTPSLSENQTSSKLSARKFRDETMLNESKSCVTENRILQNMQPSEITQGMDLSERVQIPPREAVNEKFGSSPPHTASSAETTEDHPIRKGADEAENRCEAIADPSCLPAESQDICAGNATVSLIEPSTDGDVPCNNVDEETDFFDLGNGSDVICTDSDSFNEINEATPADSEHGKLEESCIFVNEDELHFIAIGKGKEKQYKKKLRNAFSPRKRASRAQEYKQLALNYSDDAQSNGEWASSGKTLDHANPQSSQLHDVGESEWEIL